MQKLVKSQFEEKPVKENELEQLYGGYDGCGSIYVDVDCTCRTRLILSDENNENIIF